MTDADHFEQARELLQDQPATGADWPDLLDYIDHLEQDGYRGKPRLEPDARTEDVVFEAALAAGYACGIQDGGPDER